MHQISMYIIIQNICHVLSLILISIIILYNENLYKIY